MVSFLSYFLFQSKSLLASVSTGTTGCDWSIRIKVLSMQLRRLYGRSGHHVAVFKKFTMSAHSATNWNWKATRGGRQVCSSSSYLLLDDFLCSTYFRTENLVLCVIITPLPDTPCQKFSGVITPPIYSWRHNTWMISRRFPCFAKALRRTNYRENVIVGSS